MKRKNIIKIIKSLQFEANRGPALPDKIHIRIIFMTDYSVTLSFFQLMVKSI